MKGAFSKIVPSILAWIAVIIALALAPSIEKANTGVTGNVTQATNASKMIGMTAIDDFGGFLIILSILVGGGLLAFVGGKTKTTNVGDLIGVIASAILALVALNIFSGSVIGYIDDLIDAASGFAQTVYGMFAIMFYLAIIVGSGGYSAYRAYKKKRGGKKSSRNSVL